MTSINRWKKIHKFQEKPGWCGPAVVQMLLLAVGIKKTQSDIAKAVYKKWWGTNQQMILAYLSKFFKIVNYKTGATFSDIDFHLKKGNLVLVDWMDDLDPDEGAGGHYSVVVDYDSKARMLTLADPSTTRPGLWHVATKDFNPRWYDTLDVHDRTWVNGWMLWVDPKSKIEG